MLDFEKTIFDISKSLFPDYYYIHLFPSPTPRLLVLQNTIGFAPDTTAPLPTLSIMGDFNSEPHYKD